MKVEFYANMHCGACEKTISKALNKVKGIKKVVVDYVTEKIVVDYNPKQITKDEILEKVTSKGYICSYEKAKKNYMNYSGFPYFIKFLLYFSVIEKKNE